MNEILGLLFLIIAVALLVAWVRSDSFAPGARRGGRNVLPR